MAITTINCPKCETVNALKETACLSCGQTLLLNTKYKLEEVLWQSAISRTYRGHSASRSGREVVIQEFQIPPDKYQESNFNELVDNIQRLATLNVVGLPRIFEHFRGQLELGGRTNSYYLALELIEGQTLEERHSEKGTGRLPPGEVVPWVLTLIDALENLHSQPRRYLHGDIKPSTVKLASTGQVYFIDYGIGLMANMPGIDLTRNISPGYSPPEQYEGRLDARSDIYSTGALLYFLLGGVIAVEATARADRQLLTLRQVVPGFPSAIDQVVMYALRVEIHRRYQSAREMKQALRQAGQQSSARTFVPPAVGRATVEAETRRLIASGGSVSTPLPRSGTGGGIAAVNRASAPEINDTEEEIDENLLPTRNRTVGVPGISTYTPPQREINEEVRKRPESKGVSLWLIGIGVIVVMLIIVMIVMTR